MADNANPQYMADLDFCRYFLGENQYISTTVYSERDREIEIGDMAAQGWTLYMSQRVI